MNLRPKAIMVYRLASPGDDPIGTTWSAARPPFQHGITAYTLMIHPCQRAVDLAPEVVATAPDPHRITSEAVAKARGRCSTRGIPEAETVEFLVANPGTNEEEWIYLGGHTPLEVGTMTLVDPKR